jgi:uncharacterized protein (TIGR04551 family)
MRKLALLLLLPASALAQVPAPGVGETPAGSFLDRHFSLAGYLRFRSDVMSNFDLNRGPTPSTGQPIFPVPPSDPDGALAGANMRLRVDPSIRIGWGVSVHARIDFLDNIVLGSTPDGLPSSAWTPTSSSSTSAAVPEAGRNSDVSSVRVKRAWGEVVLPFGILAVGRMGALMSWGTGFFVNSGNGLDCDLGDVGDRVTLSLPILGHMVAFAFDFGASGPTSSTLRSDPQAFNLDQRDDVRSYALMIARFDTPEVVERYRRAGRTVIQYGLLASVRTQEYDVPTYYLTGDRSHGYGSEQLVRRGVLAFAGDLWFGLRRGRFSLDLEVATVLGQIDNSSLQPGTEVLQRVTSRQVGGVSRLTYAWPRVDVQLELGVASGDSAPGFGVRSPLDQYTSQPGDLDGPQLRLPGDTTVDNFRFNPDYHIDLILWRRIIGTVTDAFYARPSARWRPLRGLTLEGALVSSTALEAASTPSGDRALGVELDLSASYRFDLGFSAQLAYGVLFPLAGLDNRLPSLRAEAAHTMHLILAFSL